ncbi:hypothetical protein SPRG_22129 [Saprolegnia parasitica CBS 223.65]|uniref:Uncharacterized protein n=1 Tax=Saprolegnia parasitica (strain CBS 223.65) TaxID=695850 RepID=A0A067CK34_SAPPC|nr:hypothetical protein SPRG_22129 [Saprolegnia parasitica CBS 223.65]KDO31094.1 hypothetical protein SPRG_22129 [Saprolegnia parasitica CBS 223.65]|eukprot:XP_012198358.1 hypothetical protein SPRG_22129 [Saprolegnia parasitica CBS 223.65]
MKRSPDAELTDVQRFEAALALVKPRTLDRPRHSFYLSAPVDPMLVLPADSDEVACNGGSEGHACATQVPGDHVSIGNRAWIDALQGHVRKTIQTMFAPSGSFSLQLAYYAASLSGPQQPWAPTNRPPGTFGFLCVELPVVPAKTPARCSVWLCGATAGLSTRRPWLVYHLVLDDENGDENAAAVAALLALATRPSPQVHVLCKTITTQSGGLHPHDKAMLAALLATQAYDVLLVRLQWAKEADLPRVAEWTLPDGATLCDAVTHHPRYCKIDARLFGNGAKPTYGFVFWPKYHRAQIAHLSAIARSLAAASDETIDLFGQPSVDALLRPDDIVAVYAALGDAHRLDWIERFLTQLFQAPINGDAAFLEAVGQLISRDIAVFGWSNLEPILSQLLQRWVRASRYAHIANGCRLVASIAGVTTRPICAKVKAPGVSEWIVEAYTLLTEGAAAIGAEDNSMLVFDAIPRDILEMSFALDAYLARLPVTHRWFYGHLPNDIVLSIAAMRGPPTTFCHVLQRAEYSKVRALAPAVAMAYQQGHDALAAPWVPAVLDAYNRHDTSHDMCWLSVDVLAALLVVGVVGDRSLEVAGLMVGRLHLRVAPAVLLVLRDWPTLGTLDFIAQCSRLLLAVVTSGVDVVTEMPTTSHDPVHDYYANGPDGQSLGGVSVGVGLALDAFAYFAAFDTANLTAFVTAWVAAVVPRHVRTVLLKVTLRFSDRFPDLHRAFETLTTATLAALPLTSDDDRRQVQALVDAAQERPLKRQRVA